jgi:hypothetical protein
MPSPPISHPASGDPAARLRAQEVRIADLEAALWDGTPNEALLADYQAAFRELEELLAVHGGAGRRHRIVIVIPVADSPRQLAACLDSLLMLCRSYAYGGLRNGRFAKVAVLLADDSMQADSIARNREILRNLDRQGIDTHYFGAGEQRALMQRVHSLEIDGIVGVHPEQAFAHKGQAMMRNIAYLKLAEMRARMPGERLLFYTIDADQRFQVRVSTASGGRDLYAVNYFYHLDRIFDDSEAQLVTGKVVGDPPVSPAVMAVNFLDDVIAFVNEMAASEPTQAYRQPGADTRGCGEAAYHDMADMFGFRSDEQAYRYRCRIAGTPDNGACFAEFCERLDGFFHGEHPTRITWYRYQAVDESLQPARTVYTGNYVFSAEALDWFIPFAPLRLRMSGPTLGRLLRSAIGGRFVSANLPMLHQRTLDATGQSEFRPGVVAEREQIDLADEFERQFCGDVMLFAVERLATRGFPERPQPPALVRQTLDRVYAEMREKYRARQGLVGERLERLRRLLGDEQRWWNRSPAYARALAAIDTFVENLEHNFAPDSAFGRWLASGDAWPAWRERQLAAIRGLDADRQHWRRAMQIINGLERE